MLGEGYLILATGPAKYIDMARNLAASIRVMDGTRRICLVHENGFTPALSDARLFDDYHILKNDPLFPGVMAKMRIFPTSPYDRTMFVDADCLLMKHDFDTYWEMSRRYPFAITGSRRMTGEWKGVDVAKVLRQEGAPYLVQMNSGVFCFDNSKEANGFFSGLNDYYTQRRRYVGAELDRGGTDELYVGLWMGLNGLDGLDSVGGRTGNNSWMVSTWHAFGMRFDPKRDVSIVLKPKHSIMGVPNPLLGWDRLSPTFVHFIGLKPTRQYNHLASYFRSQVLSE